jgi:exodeoxyribonuclease V alpha subunit
VLTRLHCAVNEGRAEPLELALADWALRHGAGAPVAVALAACARAVADGHSCLDLGRELPAIVGENPICDRQELVKHLAESDLVGQPGHARPLILDDHRLYLQRYWAYETRLAERLRAMLGKAPEPVDTASLQPNGGLFDYAWIGLEDTHWQAVAAFVAQRRRFAVISGGPGTGKTYTVLRLMRLLIEAALAAGQAPPLIRLAAPTGKAAVRMVESTRAGLEAMALPESVKTHIPQQAQTLHRLIGSHPASTVAHHNRDNPLAAGVVIVDEASMVDLPMMAKLATALPDGARLILLGDRYQLASVESGSVLAQLCQAAGVNAFSREQQAAAGPLLARPTEPAPGPLADHVVTLQTSHRFRTGSAIGQLAAAVNAGDGEQTLAIAQSGQGEITLQSETGPAQLDALIEATAEHYEQLILASDTGAALDYLQTRCLLCALRRGPAGSAEINRRVSERLARRYGFPPDQRWYHGRPVIVTRNDYRAGLYNGDTGICLRDAGGTLRIWFPAEDGPRPFLPSSLPEHETVYAMTVHKSQGSEFDHVSLVLPHHDSPVLTRELLYTGLTRARETIHLFADSGVLRSTVARRIARFSGLAERLG